MPNPIDNEELYNSITLGAVRSPGIVKLSGHDRKVGWDIKKGNAQSGATMTRTSEDPVEFSATFYLLKDETQDIDDFEDWDAFQAEIDATVKSATPTAKDIYHPDLARNEIRSIVKGTVGGMVHDGKGGATVAVKFIEYKPPKKSGGQPSGSKFSSKTTDPNAAAKSELEKLTQQYQDTPWK